MRREEVLARLYAAAHDPADAQHEAEVQDQDGVIDRVDLHAHTELKPQMDADARRLKTTLLSACICVHLRLKWFFRVSGMLHRIDAGQADIISSFGPD